MSSKIDLKKTDLVYPVLKTKEGNTELRHSLRSVCRNLPHRDVWIIGNKIDWLSKEAHFIWQPDYGRAFANVNHKLIRACKTPKISDPFVFMMDDIFVMKPQTDIPFFALSNDIKNRLWRYKRIGSYAVDLIEASKRLRSLKAPAVDFEAHAPILVYKKEMREILKRYPLFGHRRTLYGNIYHHKPTYLESDFKIYKYDEDPDLTRGYISSAAESWKPGAKLRNLITTTFTTPCKYEKEEL